MLQSGGFAAVQTRPQTPVIMFLQLKSGAARPIVYTDDDAARMINAAVAKTEEMFNQFSAGRAPYEYRETGDGKYRAYDDFARVE